MTTNLRDEVASDQGKKTQCGVCRWINQQDETTAAEWRAVIADKAFSTASLHRALQRREVAVGRGSVENHRSNGHS